MIMAQLKMRPFTEEPFRYFDEEGEPVGELNHGLNAQQMVDLYRLMVRTRLMDERTLILQRQGKIAFYASSAGQEACQVGTAYALEEGDWVFPSHREQGVFLTRGMTLTEVFGHFMSKVSDPAKGRQMPGHLGKFRNRLITLSSPVATQIPQAVGCAMASKYKGEKSVAVAFFGDGATSEGDFHEGMNFAAVFKAPVVFFCVNNQYAISVPVNIQTATKTFAQKTCAYGFEGYRVDGNDVIAVYYASKKGVEKARKGGGPTLFELVTYRYAAHSSADDDKRYREADEVEEWRTKRDPIKRMKQFLLKQRILSEAEEAELFEKERQEVNRAAEITEKQPHPPLASFLEDVYANEPWFLKEEKALFEALYGTIYREEVE